MARKKQLPSVIVDYERLNEEFKSRYDRIYKAFARKPIQELREQATKLSVESPTTLTKNELVKRMTDKLISRYLPPDVVRMPEKWDFYMEEVAGETFSGIYEDFNGEKRVGNVLVPHDLAEQSMMRCGDWVEGTAFDCMGTPTLVSIKSIEGGPISQGRIWFDEINIGKRRSLEPIAKDGKTSLLLKGLQTGERVIIKGMTKETAKEIADAYPCSVAIYMGLEPEYDRRLAKNGFVVPFESSLEMAVKTANLALARAKRLAERAKDVVLVVSGIDYLCNRDIQRAIFGAGRSLIDGSLTVIIDMDKNDAFDQFAKIATRVIEIQ